MASDEVCTQGAKTYLIFTTWSGKIAYIKNGETAFLVFNLCIVRDL